MPVHLKKDTKEHLNRLKISQEETDNRFCQQCVIFYIDATMKHHNNCYYYDPGSSFPKGVKPREL